MDIARQRININGHFFSFLFFSVFFVLSFWLLSLLFFLYIFSIKERRDFIFRGNMVSHFKTALDVKNSPYNSPKK